MKYRPPNNKKKPKTEQTSFKIKTRIKTNKIKKKRGIDKEK